MLKLFIAEAGGSKRIYSVYCFSVYYIEMFTVMSRCTVVFLAAIPCW